MDETKTFTFEQKGCVLTVICQNREQRWTCQAELRFPAESHEPTLIMDGGHRTSLRRKRMKPQGDGLSMRLSFVCELPSVVHHCSARSLSGAGERQRSDVSRPSVL